MLRALLKFSLSVSPACRNSAVHLNPRPDMFDENNEKYRHTGGKAKRRNSLAKLGELVARRS